VDVSLNAYGWTGPWRNRRGFGSLAQMSTGIAAEGMRRAGRDLPVPLPAQALDHATGYLLAAAAVRGLLVRRASRAGWQARAPLARTAEALVRAGTSDDPEPLAPETTADLSETVERTAWGPARRLRPPLTIDGVPLVWDLPATPLGSSAPSGATAGTEPWISVASLLDEHQTHLRAWPTRCSAG
jgi:hypothetical protein